MEALNMLNELVGGQYNCYFFLKNKSLRPVLYEVFLSLSRKNYKIYLVKISDQNEACMINILIQGVILGWFILK